MHLTSDVSEAVLVSIIRVRHDECRGVTPYDVGSALYLHSQCIRFESQPSHQLSWLRTFVVFSVHQANSWTISWSTLLKQFIRTVPSRAFPIYQPSCHSRLNIVYIASVVKYTTEEACSWSPKRLHLTESSLKHKTVWRFVSHSFVYPFYHFWNVYLKRNLRE
jgi:hypothetical protein